MNSEELKKQAQKIIQDARIKTSQDDEAWADKITDRIPELIKDAIAKGNTVAAVMELDKEPKLKSLAPEPGVLNRAKGIIRSHSQGPRSNYLFEHGLGLIDDPSTIKEYELTGAAKIVFERCKEAGLNPVILPIANSTKYGIAICWE